MEFQSPNSSPFYQDLLREAQRAGQDVGELRRLLWLINAHPQMVGHARVLENIGALLRSAVFTPTNLSWAGQWKDSIPSWLILCDWVSMPSTQRVLSKRIPPLFNAPLGRHPLLGNGVVRHGVVAALWSRHEDHESADPPSVQFSRLQAQLLSSYMDARNLAGTLEDFEDYEFAPERPIAPTRTYPIGLSIRELTHKQNSGLLLLLPVHDESVTYARAARDLDAPHLSYTEVRCLSAINKYFQIFLEFRLGKGRQRSRRTGGYGTGGKNRVHGFIKVAGIHGAIFGEAPAKEQEDDDIPLWIQDLFTQNYPEDFKTPDALEESGLSPIEIAEPFLSLYSPEANDKKTQGTAFQRDAIETRLQRFPFDAQFLTPYEIRELEAALNPLISEILVSQLDANAKQITLLAALSLRLMLATGREFDEALNISLLTVNVGIQPDERSTDIDLGLVIVNSYITGNALSSVGGFLLRAISPSYKTELKADLQEVDSNSSPYFLIPDSIGVGQQLFDAARLLRDPNLSKLSVHRSKIREAALELLGELDEVRFSLKKVAKVLGNQIASQSGDSTLAWMICGRTKMSDQPRMFYTRYAQSQITDAYLKAISTISPNAFEQRAIVDWNNPDSTNSGDQRLVGARFVISTENLEETVSTMSAFLQTPPDGKLTQQWLINYHVAFTSYTHLFQCIETTLRTTTSPEALFLSWCRRENQSEIYVTVNDKGSHYDDRARAVLVSDELADVYSNYLCHLQLAPHHILGGRKNKKPRLLFYKWNEFVQPVPFTPKDYERVLLYFSSLNLPANFHRAYLRTELLKRVRNAEIVDAFLGHASAGELPFNRYSSFDYRIFSDEIAQHLRAIRSDLGLRPVPSMIATKRLDFAIA